MSDSAVVGHVDFAGVVEEAPDSIIFADREGRIRVWNAASERIFGHEASAVLGQSLDVIIPESLREAHWVGFDRAVETDRTKYAVGQALPTKAIHRDGHEFYVELSFSLLHGPDGAVLGALAHARDITERFNRDRETRRRVRALEQELATLREGAATPAPGA